MTDTEQERIKAICKVAHINDISDLSDGYHTFKQLYYQRMMLFAAIVKQNRDKAWKSLRHEDGELCFGGGWFIVGIDTPKGSYTYHYEDNYFGLFDCVELERGKAWDGHTEKDVTRLLSLDHKSCGDCISRQAVDDAIYEYSRSCDVNYSQLMEFIDKIPPVTPAEKVGQWIPVSERLPKAGEYVGDVAKYYLVQNEFGDMMVARYRHSEYWQQIHQLKPIGDEIVAWMPLPEPYKASPTGAEGSDKE